MTVLDKISDGELITTLPAEFLTRVDFGKFWEYYLEASLIVTPEKLQSAKQALLDAGTPARTAMYYFVELGSMVKDEHLGMVETVMYELQQAGAV